MDLLDLMTASWAASYWLAVLRQLCVSLRARGPCWGTGARSSRWGTPPESSIETQDHRVLDLVPVGGISPLEQILRQ